MALLSDEIITIFFGRFQRNSIILVRRLYALSTQERSVFNVGDTFTTNYTIFAWSIQSIEKANAGASGISYNGNHLTDCGYMLLETCEHGLSTSDAL